MTCKHKWILLKEGKKFKEISGEKRQEIFFYCENCAEIKKGIIRL